MTSTTWKKTCGALQEQPIDQYARNANRQRVPADVIQVTSNEQDNHINEGEQGSLSEDSDDSSSEHDSIAEDLISPPLADDLEQYELMREAYGKVGSDFDISNKTLKEIFNRLLPLEIALKKWPLAKLTFPLQRIVESMDRVVAGCCWEVISTTSFGGRYGQRTTPSCTHRKTWKTPYMITHGTLARRIAEGMHTGKSRPIGPISKGP